MTVIMPYITDKYTAYMGDVISGNLSLAIWIIDDYTKKGPIGHIKVNIKEGDIKPIRNPSGYYIFTDLDDKIYTLCISSEFYFFQERVIDISAIGKLDTVKLSFDEKGPKEGSTTIKLQDVSKLESGYVMVFRNPRNEIERRTISYIDVLDKNICWREGLLFDYKTNGSTILAMKYIVEITLKPKPNYPFPDNATLVRGRIIELFSNKSVEYAKIKVADKVETCTNEKGEFVLHFKNIDKTEEVTINITKAVYTKSVPITIEEWETKSLKIITLP